MDGLVCDACGATLLLDSDVRYVVKMEGYAAYDPMELTKADLERDLEEELRSALSAVSPLTAEEAQDEVHRSFQLDLCPACWRRFVKDPLSGLRPASRTDPTEKPDPTERTGGPRDGPDEERKKSQGD